MPPPSGAPGGVGVGVEVGVGNKLVLVCVGQTWGLAEERMTGDKGKDRRIAVECADIGNDDNGDDDDGDGDLGDDDCKKFDDDDHALVIILPVSSSPIPFWRSVRAEWLEWREGRL